MIVNGLMTRDGNGAFTLAAGKTLTMQNGGDFNVTGGFSNTTASTITVTGAGSTFTIGTVLIVNGGSTLNALSGGSISNTNTVFIGTAGNGTLVVDGAGSSFSGFITNIATGGNTGFATFSNGNTGSVSTLNVANSTGLGTNGTLLVQSGASVTSTIGGFTLGNGGGNAVGVATIDGAGSALTISSGVASIGAGSGSTGTLNVQNGGTYSTSTSTTTVNATGAINVTGGTFNANGNLTLVGGNFTRDIPGTFVLALNRAITVQAGGHLNFAGGQNFNNTNNGLTVTGAGSTASFSGFVLTRNNFALSVSNGGSFTAGSYTVGSGTPADNVTVSGGTSTFTVNAGAIVVGNASMTFDTGSLGTLLNVSVDPDQVGVLGIPANLTVQGGADITATTTNVGTTVLAAFVNTATLNVTGAGSTYTQGGASTFGIGSGNTGAGNTTAAVNISNGGVYTSGTGNVSLNATGTININGGTLTLAGPLLRNGGALNFNTGALNIVDNFTVGLGGLLGSDLTLDATRRFSTTATTTIDAFRTLTLNGGTFGTGALVNNGILAFNSGTVAITGAGGFNIGTGALGANVVLGVGANLQVTNTTTVANGALLRVNGGSFSGSAITNTGTIDHRDGVLDFTGTLNNAAGSRLFVGGLSFDAGAVTNAGTITLQNGVGSFGGAGAITNTGLITGDGTIGKPVTNSASGQLRAELGKTLTFTGTIAANAGTMSLQGGTLEFTSAITNGATGFISGRGALRTNGLTNQGVLAFSGGTTDVFGDVTNSSGARIVTSGAGTVTTFYDDVIHNGLEIFTGAGCSTVFFGAQSGAGSFTGTGTIYFNGDLRPGNSPASVLYEGDVVFGSASSLFLEIGGLLAGSQYDRVNVGGTLFADGTLEVALLAGFAPHFGDTFDLIDAGNFAGSFDAIDLPALAGGLEWDATNLQTTGQLRVVPEPGIGALLLSALALLGARGRGFGGARASRVLVSASRRNELPCAFNRGKSAAHADTLIGSAGVALLPKRTRKKVREGGTPSPARETRALPGTPAPRAN